MPRFYDRANIFIKRNFLNAGLGETHSVTQTTGDLEFTDNSRRKLKENPMKSVISLIQLCSWVV